MQETRKLSTLKVSKGIFSLTVSYHVINISYFEFCLCWSFVSAAILGTSLVKAKQNLTTTIAYPFTLIKPSWEEGDVITLKDINQRIRAPPKKAPETLGTSAFSGKPVIGKTRIRTDGGRGSITILRTKGWESKQQVSQPLPGLLSAIWSPQLSSFFFLAMDLVFRMTING